MEERETLSQMWAAGHSRKAIAECLGRAKSTIGRELSRNGQADSRYWAVAAQERAAVRRQERPLVRKLQRPELNAVARRSVRRALFPAPLPLLTLERLGLSSTPGTAAPVFAGRCL
jgi:IS30 family transposase